MQSIGDWFINITVRMANMPALQHTAFEMLQNTGQRGSVSALGTRRVSFFDHCPPVL